MDGEIVLVLASTSEIKKGAVSEVFYRTFPHFKIVSVSAPSNVNEQPVGDETLLGALFIFALLHSVHRSC